MKKLIFLSFLCLAGCTVGPDYRAPERDPKPEWDNHFAEIVSQEAPVDAWWSQFGDPLLVTLLEDAANHNPNVKMAEARIREARAQSRIAYARALPSVDASAGYERSRLSENSQFGRFPGIELTQDNYQVGFDARWELDLWGKERRRREAAEAAVTSTLFSAKDVMIRIYAEVARAYTVMRGTDHRIRLLEENIALQGRTLETIRKLVDGGQEDRSAVIRAEALLRQVRAQLPALRANRRAAAYSIAVLTGREPGALLEQLQPRQDLYQIPDMVRAGLRSDLLKRRPDIRMAERRLAASTAEIGVAVADLYPSVGLTTFAGMAGTQSGSLLDAASGNWAVSPSIRLPLFDRGRLRALVEVERAQAESALYAYEQTVLGAFLEVETGLTRYGAALATRIELREAAEVTTEALRLTRLRFEAGEDDLLDLLDAQRQLVETQDRLASAEQEVRTELVAVYKALGGDW
ncbi:Efflux transporter outer membrane subunit [Sulfidibacter corallicola]|uniref:Efflux transporter outer membrane subunit n=1 Tax=Sulfidibacter corallicola TaxID=2818388 RepID=A0A8A4TQP3_SULCO|nr:efflux transporter outer membrane subunit [Sulfidibacter corallicola]QTD52289.1 efflux transporter outer membrane subunit [Sulfidibacter corallicola]